MSLEIGTRCGRYELLERIGAGGMGEVYRARDLELLREVALKVLPEAFASRPVRLARFSREARATSALNHPNILTIHDIGLAEGRYFMVTELVDGVTLRQLLRTEGRLGTRRALDLAAQLAGGLASAHAAGLVHRDLKPENLMVTPDGRLKVLDFGLVRLINTADEEDSGSDMADVPTWPGDDQNDTSLTDGTLVGTVGYVSPEQARGLPADHRSDQFAMGAILYEMLTGQRAFHRPTRAETLAALIGTDPRALEEVYPEVPAPMRWVVERCLAKNPLERYASTLDLAHELRALRERLSVSRSAMPLRDRPEPTRLKAGVVAALFGFLTLGLVRGDTVPRSMAGGVLPGPVPVAVAGAAGLAPGGDHIADAQKVLEVVRLRWTRHGVAEPGAVPVVVEASLERRVGGVHLTARTVNSNSGESPALSERELMALAAAMAELLNGAQPER